MVSGQWHIGASTNVSVFSPMQSVSPVFTLWKFQSL